MRRQIARFSMPQPIISSDTGRPYPLVANRPPAIVVVAILWLAFACAMPLYQLREARRQAYQDLRHAVVVDKPDARTLIAAYERANEKLDAAASGPCLILAFTSILLLNQLGKLKRRYNALSHDLSTPGQRRDGIS